MKKININDLDLDEWEELPKREKFKVKKKKKWKPLLDDTKEKNDNYNEDGN